MDYEYLQNVMGSPYVQEGAFSRLKAKGAQAMGALGAMAGHQIQNPTETKLRSLWDGFIASLKGNMRDWSDQVSPMFDQRVPLTTEKQQQVKEALDELSRLLSSVGPKKIGTFPMGGHNPQVRNQRDNPDTYVGGSAYNRSTTTPTKLTEMVEEGFWDVAKRDMKLNKALGSNDPSTILDSYKNHILSMFQNFMKDAVKMTKMTAQQVYSVLSKMQPAQSGWQAAGNMQKVVTQLQKLQSIGDTKGQGAPPIINPHAPDVSPEAPQQPPETENPPETPPPPQTPPEQTLQSSQQSTGGQGVGSGGSYEIQPQEYPYIILHAIRIIIATVKEDTVHQGTYFSEPLPTDLGGSSLTEEDDVADDEESPTPATVKKKKIAPKDAPEVPGAFIYNLHSKHNKFPGQPFSMVVTPQAGYDPNVPELPGVQIEVIWQTDDTVNRIYVIANKGEKKSNPLMIMEFGDDDVNSIAGATTPGHSNLFSVEKLVQKSDPNAPNKLEGAPKKILSAIQKESDTLLRALMATTARKAKEFKPSKGLDLFPLSYDKYGHVTFTDSEGKSQTINKQDVVKKLNSDEKKRWTDSLKYFGYFKYFPNMEPQNTTPQAYTNAVMALGKLGYKESQAQPLVTAAWMEMMKKKPESEITEEELIKLALKDASSHKPSEEPTEPQGGAEQPEPVTSPVSGAAGAPAPTATPTAPVSDKGKQDAAAQQKQPNAKGVDNGKIDIKGDDLEWENPTSHEIHNISPDQVEDYANTKPKFLAALKANPDLYSKYKAKVDQKLAQKVKGKQGNPPLKERVMYINPFNRDNLLLS
jgi:hypothetical protein